jgi:PAS domain S-box-containing protein
LASAFDNPAILRGLADKFPFGFYVVDPNRTILYWNEAAERITGYRAQEVVGRCCADDLLVHCGSQGTALCTTGDCPFTLTLRDGRPADEHLYLRHSEGHRIPVRILAIPMLDAHGAIVAIAEMFVEENNSPEGLCWITETASRLDPQLKIPSVLATSEQLQLSLAQATSRLAVFLIEVQHLNNMRKNRGVELAETALRATVQTVRGLLTVPHYLGCWTEHRLLLLVPHCSEELAKQLPGKLQCLAQTCGLMWWGDRVNLEVKVASSLVRQDESPEELVARLETECRHDDNPGESRGCSS